MSRDKGEQMRHYANWHRDERCMAASCPLFRPEQGCKGNDLGGVVLKDEVARLFADHDGGGVGVA